MAELLVRHPPGYSCERAYILGLLLDEFLGLSFESREVSGRDVSICLASEADGPELRIADTFFQTDRDDWLRPPSLPRQPLQTWRVPQDLHDLVKACPKQVSVLYGGQDGAHFYQESADRKTWLGLDIFGSAFFMLSRYEEHCVEQRDSHGRFTVSSSTVFDATFHDTPIVNEYLEILWACLLRLFPDLVRRKRNYRVLLSHDVDRIFETRESSWPSVLRNSVGDVLKRKDLLFAAHRIGAKYRSRKEDYRYEPTNTFDFIMDSAEKYNLQSAFYWIVDRGQSRYEPDYSLDMPFVRNLLQAIGGRGHELGLHASYESYDQPERIKEELQRLIETAESLKIRQNIWGGRQHYLRWRAGSTWKDWNDAGLSYDSTLTYAERVGFRCGICFEYPVFDVLGRRRLDLLERPLVAMDVSMLSDDYMGLSPEASLDKLESLASVCRGFQGDLTLLWHNDSLVQRWQRRLFTRALGAVTA
jgi:peptidoglycan/xylan/chitin deacetylase (PgdA/CDA1 family)